MQDPLDPELAAGDWYSRVSGRADASMPHEVELPAEPIATLAAFVAMVLADGKDLQLLVQSDEDLPELSNALDFAVRPLCLVLPQADFAASIAMRATLSLLRSRLWRDNDDSRTPAWVAFRRQLESSAAVWQAAQQWLGDPSADKGLPAPIAALFPALILPVGAWKTLPPRTSAITLLYRCDAPTGLDVPAKSLLRVGCTIPKATGRTLQVSDETTQLLLERTRLTQDIADLELELASVQAELGEFMRDYYSRVGQLMAEHDALQAAIAARKASMAPDDPTLREAAEASGRQADESAQESARASERPPEEAAAFSPDAETRKLFRRLAQQIHPDRAVDDDDRAWRTQLMSEANRAYRHGDIAGLREIAALWQEQPAARATSTPGLSLLQSQLQSLRARLMRIEGELHRLFGSPLYELFIAARQARRQNRDLLDEMARRLEATITELRQAA